MAYSAKEQAIYDWIRGSVPRWFFAVDRAEEMVGAAVKILARVQEHIDWVFDNTFILDAAPGPDADWLEQHAVDRGERRAEGESDASLAARLRNVPDAVTRPAILSATQAVMDAGTGGTVSMVELPEDGAFLGTYTHTGFTRAYASRGYRTWGAPPNTIVLMLPYGTTDAEVAAVDDVARARKAAGIRSIVERREVP